MWALSRCLLHLSTRIAYLAGLGLGYVEREPVLGSVNAPLLMTVSGKSPSTNSNLLVIVPVRVVHCVNASNSARDYCSWVIPF